MHWSEFRTQNEIKHHLMTGREVDFDYPVAYPLKNVGTGGYATCFQDANGLIIRVSYSNRDKYTDMLSPYSSALPNVHASREGEEFHITIRDDISDIPVEMNNRQQIPDSDIRALYPVTSNIADFGITYFEVIEQCLGARDFHDVGEFTQKFIRIHTEYTEATLRKEQKRLFDEYNHPRYVIVKVKNHHQLQQEEMWTPYRMCAYLQLCYLMENGHKGNIIPILNLFVQYYRDFGCYPQDFRADNIGVKNGKLVIRDAYNGFQHDGGVEFPIRHRVNKGMSLSEEMLTYYKPWRINLDAAWLATKYKKIRSDWRTTSLMYDKGNQVLLVSNHAYMSDLMRHMESRASRLFELYPEYKLQYDDVPELDRVGEVDAFRGTVFIIPHNEHSFDCHNVLIALRKIDKFLDKYGIEFYDAIHKNDLSRYPSERHAIMELMTEIKVARRDNPSVWEAMMCVYEEFGVMPNSFSSQHVINGKICNLEFGDSPDIKHRIEMKLADHANKNSKRIL